MKRALLAAAAAALVSGCGRRSPCDFVAKRYDALPLLKPIPKDSEHLIRILYLEDGRVPGLDAKGRAALYSRVETLVPRWLGHRVKLREVGARDLRAEFARADAPFKRPQEAACIADADFEPLSARGRDVVLNLMEREYALRGAAVFDRLFPQSKGLPAADAQQSALRRFLALQNSLAAIATTDGPLIQTPEDRAMYSFMRWSPYLRELTEADFVLTNAALLVPDNDMPIYVLARGGLTTGFVDNAPAATYGATGMVTLLPFLSGERLLNPAGRATTAEENLDAAATMWLHELGHFLNRYGEMYGETGCVHVASEGLDYFEWHRAIRKNDNRCTHKPAVVAKF